MNKKGMQNYPPMFQPPCLLCFAPCNEDDNYTENTSEVDGDDDDGDFSLGKNYDHKGEKSRKSRRNRKEARTSSETNATSYSEGSKTPIRISSKYSAPFPGPYPQDPHSGYILPPFSRSRSLHSSKTSQLRSHPDSMCTPPFFPPYMQIPYCCPSQFGSPMQMPNGTRPPIKGCKKFKTNGVNDKENQNNSRPYQNKGNHNCSNKGSFHDSNIHSKSSSKLFNKPLGKECHNKSQKRCPKCGKHKTRKNETFNEDYYFQKMKSKHSHNESHHKNINSSPKQGHHKNCPCVHCMSKP